MRQIEWTQLVEDLRNVEDLERSMEAAQTIAEITDQSYVPLLYELLKDEDIYVREAAAEPLANLEGVKALPALFRAITQGEKDGHDNDSLCHFVIELLELEAGKVTPLLLGMIKDQDETTRANAAWALGFVAAEIKLSPLLEALHDSSPQVRSAAAGSLGSFKNEPRIVDELLSLVSDSDEQVCVSAIASLGYLRNHLAIPTLRNLLKDPRKRVREFAEYALQQFKVS